MRRDKAGKASGVFHELGFRDPEAEHLGVRAELLLALQQAVVRRKLTQADAAKLLGITQPRVSNLLAGRLDLFSSDALIDLLARVGIGTRLLLRPVKSKGRVARGA
jgi:predicted XRE-type DNA-binding protein